MGGAAYIAIAKAILQRAIFGVSADETGSTETRARLYSAVVGREKSKSPAPAIQINPGWPAGHLITGRGLNRGQFCRGKNWHFRGWR